MKEEGYIDWVESVYLMELYVGSPPRSFLTIIDTGSCEFWVPKQDCSSRACRYKQKYQPEKSFTSIGPISSFVMAYLDAGLKGKIYQDNVEIAGLLAEELHFGGVTAVRGIGLDGNSFDGILGMCPRGSKYGHPHLLDNLRDSGHIKERIFSIWLSANPKEGGRLSLGKIATDRLGSNIKWFQTTAKSKWTTDIVSVSIDDEVHPLDSAQALLDSGSSMMIVPEWFGNEMHYIMRAHWNRKQYMMEIDCAAIRYLPEVKITLGNTQIYLDPDQYTIVNDHGCFSAFEARNVSSKKNELWVLGAPFLRAYFTIYDLDHQRFGIAVPRKQYVKAPQCALE